MIELKNIDLSKVCIYKQISKVAEEENEFMEAFQTYADFKNSTNKKHLIEEFYDRMQSALGLLQKLGIDADEVMECYPKHLEKIKNRPR